MVVEMALQELLRLPLFRHLRCDSPEVSTSRRNHVKPSEKNLSTRNRIIRTVD